MNCVALHRQQGKPWGEGGLGYRPFTNDAAALDVLNVAGAASAVIRRRVFDLGFCYSVDATSYEDWLFYRDLSDSGYFGQTIPEELLLYRVLDRVHVPSGGRTSS